MIIALLAAVALAGPARSPEQLTAQGERADALIDRCQRLGRGCAATESELGEAFLVRAVSAAVVEGRVDAVAAANARVLAPDAVAEWSSLLSDGGEPEDWVLTWRDGPEEAAVPAATPSSSSPAPDPEAPFELRTGGSLRAVGGRGAVAGMLQARIPVGARVSVLAEGRHLRSSVVPLGIDGLPEELVLLEDRVRLGAGPRWVGRAGDLHLVAAATGSLSTMSRVTREELAALDSEFARAASRHARELDFQGGGAVGLIGAHPFVRDGALALRWEGWLQVEGDRRPELALSPSAEEPIEPEDVVETGETRPVTFLTGTLEPGLRWAPGDSGLTVGASALLEVERLYLAGMTGRRGEVGLRATVGWLL